MVFLVVTKIKPVVYEIIEQNETQFQVRFQKMNKEVLKDPQKHFEQKQVIE